MAAKRGSDKPATGSPQKRRRIGESSQASIEHFFKRKNTQVEQGQQQSSHSNIQGHQEAISAPEVIVIDELEEEQSVNITSTTYVSNQTAVLPVVPTPTPPTRQDINVDTDYGKHLNVSDYPSLIRSVQSEELVLLSETDSLNFPKMDEINPVFGQNALSSTVAVPRGQSIPLNRPAKEPFPFLDVDPFVFDPCTKRYSPWWETNTSAPYSLIAHALKTLAGTRSRIVILSVLTNLLRILIWHDPNSVLPALYLLSNSLGPSWLGIELGCGGSTISKAIQQTTSLSRTELRNLYKQFGDPGDVVFQAVAGNTSISRTSVLKPHPPLRIKPLYDDLRRIAAAKGSGSQKFRQGVVERLLLSAIGSSWSVGKHGSQDLNPQLRGEEARYLIRTLSQNLRVGAVRTTILSALARAVVLTPPKTINEVLTDEELAINPSKLDNIRAKLLDSVQDQDSSSPRKSKGKGVALLEDADIIQAKQALSKAEAIIRTTFARHPSYDDIVSVLLLSGMPTLSGKIGLSLGTPLLPMLGSPMRSLDDVYDRLGATSSWTAEMKYDGQRAQVHAWEGQGGVNVKIFSRHLEDMTEKYPDLVLLVTRLFERDPSISSFIVDAEVVAVDSVTGDLRSFQDLATRARRDVKLEGIKVAVCLFLYDLMLLNDNVLIEQPFRDRRSLLRSRLPPLKLEGDPGGSFQACLDHVESVESSDGREVVEEFWEKAVESKCEGLMIKLLDDSAMVIDDDEESKPDDYLSSPQRKGKGKEKKSRKADLPATYEPDKRTFSWLKLKKDYVDGVGDSLDLVPVGAWHGNGRKAAWWSPILLGVYDQEQDIFVALCKCMSGFTDSFYKALNERYSLGSDTCSADARWNVETGGYRPSVYFKPMEVWEVRGADLTPSPVSTTALGMVSTFPERGISLRFPRFIKIREDKRINDSSSPSFVLQLFHLQNSRGGGRATADQGEDDELIDFEEKSDDGEEDLYAEFENT